MPLIILEGLDRTGKSTVARYYEDQGYEVIHQSAPVKGLSADLFLEEQMQLVSSAASKNIVLDRSYYGELVWPSIYGRASLLTEDGLELLQELEVSVGITRILMHDPNIEEHWKRCMSNREPLTKAQFITARRLFNQLVEKHEFTSKTLKDFAIQSVDSRHTEAVAPAASRHSAPDNALTVTSLTKEQQKLETANAINDVLSKRILKNKGVIYDQLEHNIRAYLSNELAKIFGTSPVSSAVFNNEEVELLKFFCENLKKKAGNGN